jgi:Cu+-exporting ATPase
MGGTPKMGEKAKDVVCGMQIHKETAAATSVYQGKTYYFCAQGCKKKFDADPKAYAAAEG